MIPDVSLNFWAVLISAAVSTILGMIWYSSFLFGKISSNKLNSIKSKKNKIDIGAITLVFIGWLLSGYVLAHLVVYETAGDIIEGMQVGFWVWLGFVAPFLMGNVLWKKGSWTSYLITISYYLVALCLQAAIIMAWR